MIELEPGAFIGETESAASAGAIFSHVSHKLSRTILEHTHQWPYVSILLRGVYEERVEQQKIVFQPMTMVFHGPRLSHQDTIGTGGADFFLIEFGESWWPTIARSGVSPKHAYEVRGEGASWAALRLYNDFQMRALSEEATEEALYSLCAHLPRAMLVENSEPAWLRSVDDYLSEHFRERYSLREVAQRLSVDPAHLARTYHRFRERTIGDAVNRLRAQEAYRRITGTGNTLEIIARECGFADQSHMTRSVRDLSGTTPAALRRRLPPRK